MEDSPHKVHIKQCVYKDHSYIKKTMVLILDT